VLVNNAGVLSGGLATEMPDAAWRRLMGTNIDAAFWVARAVGRRMVERGAGKVINIGSIAALASPERASVAYAASKAALHGLTRALCARWAGRGVQVNCIAPGFFETDTTRALHQDPEAAEARRRRTPAGRWGRPEDLAGTAVFLAAPASDFVNGQVIVVDGGILAVI
jgi:NAD(P)-dependent dehydrogenase (short-subunit alcohol dehydrogenase family)